ncbi:hypothetical protein [Saccharolobus solfataricus]|uniref:Uncharacterized protein n=1 Tax=Saccharolobus solfataricus TaxID=2287 RepID=A0A3G8EP18_SACSO|nr:hypothetical protein [Saccharolobus solfataricus]AZF83452.1 hypothetical protein SULZ_04720 [Saccharolobus solfataricus]
MPSEVTEEFIIIIAVVLIGLVLFGFVTSYFIPHEIFSLAQQQASSISSSTTVSVGPLIFNSGSASTVIEAYNPAISGNITLIVFPEPSYLQQDVGLVTPQSPPQFSVYLSNEKLAKSFTISIPIYDVNGRIIYDSQITAYTVPFNTPVTITVNGVGGSNYILIVWVLYNSNGYWFRIGYTFRGVPST